MIGRLPAIVITAVTATVLSAAPASAHGLVGRFESPLPLAAYLGGAAIAVGLSFLIGFAYHGTWRPGTPTPVRPAPRWLVLPLRILGLLAWAWIIAQWIVGGSSSAEVGTLFTWVYGWVGVAIISALVAPVWEWIDPFATLHDAGAWVLRRAGTSGWRPAPWPARAAAWPATVGFAIFVWLELAANGPDMGAVVAVYTLITLAGMAQFGRDRWRSDGEVFSVWFGTLNRLARWTTTRPGTIRRQHFPDGLLGRPWDTSRVTLVALATGAILFDGLSQTQLWFELFGVPGPSETSLLLIGFLGIVVGLALAVARSVGPTAMGAGLLPISVGYLIAHYLTYLLSDGQRIVIAIADPLQLGWDVTGTAFFEPSIAWLPASITWAVMFSAVVGGHVLGAWAGHLDAEGPPNPATRSRLAQWPLAAVMVGLTTVTLWSLGQTVFRPGAETAAIVAPARFLPDHDPEVR